MPKSVRCAIYTRKSSEEGLEQSFNSLDAQREASIAYIESQKHEGWSIIEKYYDDGGYSGGNMDRPGLQALLADIAARRVDTVVVYKVDRLTRSLSDFAKIIEVLDSNQVSFVSVTQQFNTTTSMGRLTLNVLLSFAQFERELTGERIRDKVVASKKKGMWMGGVVPLGYDGINHRLVLNREEAEIVRRIFAEYARLGSVAKLRRYLDEAAIRSKSHVSAGGRSFGGMVWSRGALYHLLSNRIYIGQIVHKDRFYAGLHEAIISGDLWDQVAALLRDHTRRRQKATRSSRGLLTGIIWDSNGVRFTPTHSLKNGRRYRYYVSQAAIQKHDRRPQVTRIPAPELEQAVIVEVGSFLNEIDRSVTGTDPKADAAIQKARALAAKWPNLPSAARISFIKSILSRVVIGAENFWLTIDKNKLIATLSGEPAVSGSPEEHITHTATARFYRDTQCMRLRNPESTNSYQPSPAIIRAIARAYMWREQLTTGKCATLEKLANQEGVTTTYIEKIFRCAMLSPTIIDAILNGRLSRQLTLAAVVRDMPHDWHKQISRFGSTADDEALVGSTPPPQPSH